MADEKATEGGVVGWFKGLSTGWKILVVILAIGVLGTIPYVLSGQYAKDEEARKQAVVKQEDDKKKHEEELKVAYKKCMLMEMTDIYNMPDASFIGQKYTKQQASTPANTFCVEQKNADEEKYLEAVNVDWENRKNEVILGYPLTYWLENYHLFPQKYYDSFEQ